LNHVHFGAGKFGLGFVGWISNHLDLKLHLANRSYGDTGALSAQNQLIAEQLTYQIEHSSDDLETVRVSEFLNFDSAPGRQRLVGLIASPETMMITTSLGLLPQPVVSIIQDGLIARAQAKAPPLFVLACENELKSADLQDAVEKGAPVNVISRAAHFVPCVVDRICREVTDDGHRVVVHAERYGCLSLWNEVDLSWFRDRLSAQARAVQAMRFERSAAHLEFADRKKKWLINGPHLLLAINAYYDHQIAFEEFVRQNRLVARNMLQEFAAGCFHVCSQGSEPVMAPDAIRASIEEKVEEVLERLANFPDVTTRIMRRFVRPSGRNPISLQDFFRNMRYKVVQPARAYYEAEGEMPHRISDTFLKLIELIANDEFISST
jgi:mannitol-1-phosphate/altronate dehydrogenase